MTPVEATATWVSDTPATMAPAPCIFAAASRPARPVAAFALPALAAIARRAPRSQRSLLVSTGAEYARAGEARRARRLGGVRHEQADVGLAAGLDPGANPGGAKARGQPGSLAHVRGCLDPAGAEEATNALALRPAEHQVEVLDGLRGGALPQVVDRREDEHLAGPPVAHGMDAADVGVADLAHPRRTTGRARRTARPHRRPRTGRGALPPRRLATSSRSRRPARPGRAEPGAGRRSPRCPPRPASPAPGRSRGRAGAPLRRTGSRSRRPTRSAWRRSPRARRRRRRTWRPRRRRRSLRPGRAAPAPAAPPSGSSPGWRPAQRWPPARG